jgi:hypothetical protein
MNSPFQFLMYTYLKPDQIDTEHSPPEELKIPQNVEDPETPSHDLPDWEADVGQAPLFLLRLPLAALQTHDRPLRSLCFA